MRRLLVAAFALLLACDGSSPPKRATSANPPPSTPPSPAPPSPQGSTPIATARPPRGHGTLEGIDYLVGVTGGADPTAELPLVVAVHGLGDRPDRFRLFRGYPHPLRVVRPRGTSPHGGGFSWFDVKVDDVDRAETVVSLRQAGDRLARFLTALRRAHPTKGKPILTGFSQGGMLSFTVGARHPEAIAVAIPLAGWLPPPITPEQAPAGAVSIFALHGEEDPILPLAPTERSVAALREAGFDAHLTTYPGVAHQLSEAMLRELHRRVAEAAAAL